MNRRTLSIFFALAASFGVTRTVVAQDETGRSGVSVAEATGLRPREETYFTTRGIGMGLGGRAGATGISALAYNAANLTLLPLYHIDTTVTYLAGQNAWSTGAAIADSTTGNYAAGASFRGVYGNGDHDYTGFVGRLAIGMNLGERIALGTSARYFRLNADRQTESGQDIGEEARGFTMDGSVRITAHEKVTIAGFANNFIDRGTPLAPVQFGGGVAVQLHQRFQIAVDGIADLSSFDQTTGLFGGGTRLLFGENVPMWAGYIYDTGRDLHTLTFGLGFVERTLSADVALRQDLGSDRESLLLFSFRYHVPNQ